MTTTKTEERFPLKIWLQLQTGDIVYSRTGRSRTIIKAAHGYITMPKIQRGLRRLASGIYRDNPTTTYGIHDRGFFMPNINTSLGVTKPRGLAHPSQRKGNKTDARTRDSALIRRR